MDYREALGFLSGLRRFGMRPGLETPRALAAAAGVSPDSLRFIHVAGTNGKGSTCAFLEGVYRCAGFRVGLYTSPHLVSVRERLQVNRSPVSESEFVRLVAESRRWVAAAGTGEHPTFFEVMTVLALRWFQKQRCDVVIWETGLGGRLDATNIVTPLASVITNVGWDHMQWLGNTLPAIAREKAGIIKPGVPVLTATEDHEVWEVLDRAAREKGSPIRRILPQDPDLAAVRAMHLPLAGEHQVWNAALARAAVGAVRASLPASDRDVRRGLEGTRWDGRFDVRELGARKVVLDGAHNLPAFQALSATLRQAFPGQRFGLILGMLADKDARGAARELVPGAARTLVVPVHTGRAGDPKELAGYCAEAGGGERVGLAGSVSEAMDQMAGEAVVVVTGSLYLVGEALEWMFPGTTSERELNDWSPTR